jgi:hypothetical protein
MMQTMTKTRTQEYTYSFIADAGSVTREEVVAFLGIDDFTVDAWLRRQVEEGYVFRDEFGAYSTACPWPRVGF